MVWCEMIRRGEDGERENELDWEGWVYAETGDMRSGAQFTPNDLVTPGNMNWN
jgi:hypothetical protein